MPPGTAPWDTAHAVWSPTANGRLLRPRSLQGPSTLNLRQLWPWEVGHTGLWGPLWV